MVEQPSGTVTLVFTDIEGSTRLLHELGQEGYRKVLAAHRRIVREAFGGGAGYEVSCEGDAFFYAFPSAPAAVAAVAEAMRGLEPGPIRIRVGVHTGDPGLDPPKYIGLDVHRAARIMAAGHGGQTLISQTTRELLDDRFALRDLGQHRLKDLAEPRRLYQLGAGEFPPLKTLHQTNLPVQPTPLIGRKREIEELLGLLRREDVVLVTLTGAGGSGKSRLAVHVAAEAADDYRDGVWFVPLATLADPSLVVATIAQALGLREGGGRTFGEVLGEYLGSRRLLLVLDNVEQLLPGVARPLAELVAASPGLALLATSREPLRIAAEHEYPLLPLAPAEATALFAERATAVRPGFELDAVRPLVDAICERLDRLPLAIELAAARARVLPPAKLLERLEQRLPLLTGGARDAPDRQRSLRATIAWSHDLLEEDERRLFARLAVFTGGCTLEAAEVVCDADLDTLTALIEKNLIRQEDGPDAEPRNAMLETVREFALERLEETTDGEEIRRRHAEHFLALALAAEPELSRREQRRWLDRLEADHDNFRAALRWLLDRGDPEYALRLARALGLFWYKRGHIREGRDTLLASLERASPGASETRARGLDYAGLFCAELGEEGRAFAEQAVACARDADAPAALALCHLVAWSDRIDESVAVLEEARSIAEAAGDPLALGIALNNLGHFTAQQGHLKRVHALFEESYRVRAGMGDLAWMSLSLMNLAETEHSLGDTARARERARPRRARSSWRARSATGVRPGAPRLRSPGSRSTSTGRTKRVNCSSRRSRLRTRSPTRARATCSKVSRPSPQRLAMDRSRRDSHRLPSIHLHLGSGPCSRPFSARSSSGILRRYERRLIPSRGRQRGDKAPGCRSRRRRSRFSTRTTLSQRVLERERLELGTTRRPRGLKPRWSQRSPGAAMTAETLLRPACYFPQDLGG